MKRIFIAEDDKSLRESLKKFLEMNSFEVLTSTNFKEIENDIIEANPDILLLDLKLETNYGYNICKKIRKTSNMGIIVITSENTELAELMSINSGADDYISKPFNSEILLARLNALLNRFTLNTQLTILEHKGLRLNLSDGTINFERKSAELTKNELRILTYLIKNKNTICSRNSIMNELWHTEEFIDENTLNVNIKRLRKKLNDIGLSEFIVTKRQMGYMV